MIDTGRDMIQTHMAETIVAIKRQAAECGITLANEDFLAPVDPDDLLDGSGIGMARLRIMMEEAEKRGDAWEQCWCRVRMIRIMLTDFFR